LHQYPLDRFTAMASLGARDIATIRGLGETAVAVRRHETIRREGQPVDGVWLMLHGWVASSMLLPAGQRQIVKVHIAGDMLGTPSMALERAADTLTALTDGWIARVPLARLRALFDDAPRVAALLLMAVQLERVALMDAVAAIGKTSARERLANFLVDLHQRLSQVGLTQGASFDMPLTQEQIGDALGLTAVHVNRTIRALEREGLIARRGQTITLGDLPMLERLSPLPRRTPWFDPDWLPAGTGGPASDDGAAVEPAPTRAARA
jgi:CRP/FNR family transcriptional regulator, anaerobic regulatory protein